MTWQAYNGWGGRSLYEDSGSFADRSYAVSFDRPYDEYFGAGRFLPFDAPVVQVAEAAGVPLAWVTDYDLAERPQLVQGAAAVVIGGHAEYWTAPMWDAVRAAVRRGSNLAVLGANTAYWRVRLAEPVAGADRVIVGTKDAGLDPLARSDPSGATARFRDRPAARREEDLTGMRYDCFPADASWTVTEPHWWGYAGTGVRQGQQLAGLVGPESDRVYPAPTRPRPMTVVGYSRFLCGPGRPTAQTGVYWVARSGAGVFATGTMRWSCALRTTCAETPASVRRIVRRVTITVLTAFAQPRAGVRHPAVDTVGHFWLPTTGTGTAAPAD
jgi:N,N-dimethylformamidase beta subunit-like protein